MEAIKKIQALLVEAQQIAKDEFDLDNIFYNERFIEMFMANHLGHEYGNNTQGGDALDESGTPTEYKAINMRNKGKSGTFQFHWLSENKIEKYAQTNNMYFAVRDGVTIQKIYEVPTNIIMPVLEAKATGGKSINGHAGFNEKKLIETFNAKLVYDSEKEYCYYSGLTSPAAYE
jgi:hypothetical protein|tara:strand:+ start:1295 stop:1816 length:522 start_codon:yes stop_codon:yes gene_type:complete